MVIGTTKVAVNRYHSCQGLSNQKHLLCWLCWVCVSPDFCHGSFKGQVGPQLGEWPGSLPWAQPSLGLGSESVPSAWLWPVRRERERESQPWPEPEGGRVLASGGLDYKVCQYLPCIRDVCVCTCGARLMIYVQHPWGACPGPHVEV